MPRLRKVSASHANKGITIVAIGPLSNRALQLSAWIPKHSAHMVSWKLFWGGDGGGFGRAF